MLDGKFFLTVLLITIAVSAIQWFFIGFLFHKYQAATPATWRKESGRSYAASTLLSLVFAFLFTLIWVNLHGNRTILESISVGAIFWLAFSLTAELGMAVYVNFSPVFVFGKCLSALVEYVAAGIIAALML
jgi:uncharacterized paraquat-inducible protein A